MQKQRIFLIVGIILAVVVVFLIKFYLDQQRQIALEEAKREAIRLQTKSQLNQSAVMVAKQDIPKGTPITQDLLDTKIVPTEFIAPQAVTSFERVSGMVAINPIAKGEQITLSRLAYPKQIGGLAEATPVGKRAITINVDNIASVAGMIKPGDYVDLLATIPVPALTPDGKQATQIATVSLLQNVLILAVGQETGAVLAPVEGGRYTKGEQRREASSLVTLALGPQEANLVAFVQEQGKFRLVLRSPVDSQVQPLKPMTWEGLFQYLLPKELGKAEAPQEVPKPPIGYVEVYRGLKREKVPLSR